MIHGLADHHYGRTVMKCECGNQSVDQIVAMVGVDCASIMGMPKSQWLILLDDWYPVAIAGEPSSMTPCPSVCYQHCGLVLGATTTVSIRRLCDTGIVIPLFTYLVFFQTIGDPKMVLL